jgi:1,5-anhydro-D-fructose reductase (1,5-anhydro-D-mannitol-forming)
MTGPVWGLVGTGRMARQFGRAILAAGHVVGAVVGRSAEGAAVLAAELGAPMSGVDTGLLRSAGVELGYIASPNDRHAEHLAALAGMGLPVLCEKPLAATAAEARAIREAAGDGRTRIRVAFQYRQHPAHRRAREIIAAGELGELRMVEVAGCLPALDVPDWYDDPATSGGGILPMTGVHRVDLVRHLVGRDYAYVSATTAHHRGARWDDAATIAAVMAGDVGCSFQFGLDMPRGDDRVAVHGTAGSLVLDSTMSQWWSTAPGTLTVRRAEGVRVKRFEQVDAYRLQVEDFAAGGATVATLDDAVAVAEFSEAVYASAAEGRRIVLAGPMPS